MTEAPNDLAEVDATNDQVHFVDAETMELIEQKLSDIDKQVENVRQILKNLPRSYFFLNAFFVKNIRWIYLKFFLWSKNKVSFPNK